MSTASHSSVTNANVVNSCTSRIDATTKYITADTEIPIAGVLQKPATIIATYQKSLETRAAVNEARAVLKDAIGLRDAAEVERLAVDEGMKSWVLQRFGADSRQAHEFGFQARKLPVRSAASKAAAVELARETRILRGGSARDRAKLKATRPTPTPTPTETNVAPTTVAATPAPPPAAAPLPPSPASNGLTAGGAVTNGAAHLGGL